MSADVLIINGSPRAAGGTAAVAESLTLGLGDRLRARADLAALPMAHFSYESGPEDDGFMQVVDQMLAARTIIFVTPVYWYAMSGLMKVFFDRLTDLVLTKPRRPTGRALAGRAVWLAACGTDEAMPPGFETPFALTCDYFGWTWKGSCYVRSMGSDLPASEELEHARSLGAMIAAQSG